MLPNLLSRQLGFGHAPLRKALKAFEIMSGIETCLGDATYFCQRSDFHVSPLLWAIASESETDLRELIEARALTDVEVAGMAVERAKRSDISQLVSL